MDINALYRSLPRSVQNLALMLYGWRQYRIRFPQNLPAPYDRLSLHDHLPADVLRTWQESRFSALVNHAAEYVPHYKKLFTRLGVNPNELTLANFDQVLPILSKAEIIAAPEQFYSSYFGKNAISLFTSGTSGSPMPIKCSSQGRALNYAFYRSLLRKHDSDIRDRSATFAGRILVAPNEKSDFFRKDYYNRTLYLSSYHINDATIARYIDALEAWQPVYIDSYPSAIGLIAAYINDRKIKHRLKLKFVLTSSETLTDSQRESISSAFDCKVVDHYGCSEMAVSASSDRVGHYEVDPLYGFVEFLPSTVPGGSSLVCTGLINFAMPLIRYSIGDVAGGVESTQGGKGQGRQYFRQIVGREDDVITTSDGRKIGRMDPAFKGVSGISQAQIVQRTLTDIEVLVVPSQGNIDHAKLSNGLEERIKQRTSLDMRVKVTFVEAIPLNKAGKFKSVVSLLPQ